MIRAAVAAAWGAAISEEVDGAAFPTCSRCSDPELRDLWGCDRRADEPVFQTSQGPLYRCPNAILRSCSLGRAVADSVDACRHAEAWGTLPVEGGTRAQAAAFLDASRIVDAERAWWEKRRAEKLRRDARRR